MIGTSYITSSMLGDKGKLLNPYRWSEEAEIYEFRHFVDIRNMDEIVYKYWECDKDGRSGPPKVIKINYKKFKEDERLSELFD